MKTAALHIKDLTPHELVEKVQDILRNQRVDVVDDVNNADLVLSIGGDGTFLNAAAWVGRKGTPILGINSGHLGFLADVTPDSIDEDLPRVLQGDYVIQSRSLLEVLADGAPLTQHPIALNEVAILKHDNSSLIQIETYINTQLLNKYLADGLIVSTPTGSTGYSLSAGGPIATPDCGCFCISAVAPHSLNVRPVILRDDVEIDLHIHSRSGNYLLAIDGHSQSLPDSTTLKLRRADYSINVVKVQHREFFDTLRNKMHWGTDNR